MPIVSPANNPNPYDQLINGGGGGGGGGLSGSPLIFTAPVAGDQATYAHFEASSTLTTVEVKLVGGTSCQVQLVRNINGSNLTLLSAPVQNLVPGSWVTTTNLQNASFAIGDDLTVQIIAAVGNPSEIDVKAY